MRRLTKAQLKKLISSGLDLELLTKCVPRSPQLTALNHYCGARIPTDQQSRLKRLDLILRQKLKDDERRTDLHPQICTRTD